MAEFTLRSFAAALGELAIMHQAEREGLEKAATIVETEAKRVIGTYDYDWVELAQSTQTDRMQRGFPPNEPLLRTGELRDSIQHTVGDREAHIGSNNQKAVWQELGTSRIPPRSFLGAAAVHKEKEVVAAIGRSVYAHLISKA